MLSISYRCFPAHDIGVKAHVVERDVEAAVREYFALQSARVVDEQVFVGGQLELLLEVLVLLLVRVGERLQRESKES